MTTITRVGHCTQCYVNNNPRTGIEYIVFGGTSQKYKIAKAKHNGRRGFVPHIYILDKVVEQRVFYRVICGICGLKEIGETGFARLDETKWKCKSMTIADWNGLVRYKDSDFKI